MAALNFPSSPTVGQMYGQWYWDGAKWVAGVFTPGIADIRSRHTRTAYAYPGTNLPINFNAQTFATTGAPTHSAGTFTVVEPGLYTIDFAVNWGTSVSPAVVAAWLNVINQNGTVRYSSAQAIPGTTSESGWVTNGSATVYLRVNDTFQVQVYTASGSPAGLSSAEINIARVASAYVYGPSSIATDQIADGAVTQAKITHPVMIAWTPTLRQSNGTSGGNITIASNQSYYTIDGPWVFGRFQFSVAAGQAGTASAAIRIGLPPVTPDVLVGSFGLGNLYDDDPGYRYPAFLDMIGNGEFWLADSSLGGASWALGNCAAFALALAQYDGFSGSFMYRKA